MKLIRLLSLSLFCINVTFGQVESPPDLSVGAQGLIFEKGSIDVELLSELITEKQDELKKELIKRNLINVLHQNNFTSYAFAYSSLTDIMTVSDKSSMSKKLLIYIEDFALVYGFSEFYLHTSGKLGNTQLDSLLSKVTVVSKSDSKELKAIDVFPKSKVSDPAALYLGEYAKYNLKEYGQLVDATLSDLLIDYFYSVLKANQNVSERGFLKLENYGNISYLYTTYNKFLTSPYVDDASDLTIKINAEINLLFRYYTLLKDIKNVNINLEQLIPDYSAQFNYSLEGKTTAEADTIKARAKNYVQEYIKDPFEQLGNNKSTFYNDLQSINMADQNYTESTQQKLSAYVLSVPDLVAAAEDLMSRYKTLTFDYSNYGTQINTTSAGSSSTIKNLPFDAADLYYINRKAKPVLAYLTKFGNLNAKYLNNLERVEEAITIIMIYNALDDIKELNKALGEKNSKHSVLAEVNIGNFTSFVGLITSLDEFNLADTYINGLEILSTASELFQGYKAGQYLKILVDLLQTYTNADIENNEIDINVQQIIVELYDKFVTNNSDRPVHFFFTLGINTTLQTGKDNTLLDSKGNPVDNLIFAGEKIGLKFNIYNVEKRRLEQFATNVNNNEKPKLTDQVKPIFSEFYLSAYTSGLLYNLVNTTNADEKLGGYMVGTALGTSFFNNMDLSLFLNFYATKTQDFQLSNTLIGVSWDIPIIEYITALTNKNSNTNQTDEN
ncbi:MAG: hypothetical protein HRT68_08990 [Flavobacteriaceae bacterium]|nr:hypothetical protein [Flavobacteriaceae bacterium]